MVPSLGVEALHIPGSAPQQVAAALAHNPAVKIAEPDYVLEVDATNDPGYDELWGLDNRGQTGGLTDVDVDAPEAWAHTTGSSDVIVAVIDTGIDISHPDLAANIWTNPGEIAGNGIDDDRDGYVDDVHGWDFYNGDDSVFDHREARTTTAPTCPAPSPPSRTTASGSSASRRVSGSCR